MEQSEDGYDLSACYPSPRDVMPPDDPAEMTSPGCEPNDMQSLPSPQSAGHSDTWTWRCLACDSLESAWLYGEWVCCGCGTTDFYRTNQPAKKMTSDGTWMYIPKSRPAVVQPLSKAARRRKRRPKYGGDPSGSLDGFERDPEEESHTTDPLVELTPPPSAHPMLKQQGAPRPSKVPSTQQSNAQENQLLDALRKLVSSKKTDDDDWNSAAGPSKGVRWRGGAIPQPPVWRYDRDDLRAYSKFVKKVDIWKLQAAPYLSKKEMALSLYNSLQGEAEQELEHTPIEDIHRDDGVERILTALKGPMEQKVVYQKRKFLHEFENLRRYAGETMRTYINRFRRSQRCLQSVGIDVSLTYDDESMGARLLDRSGLSQEGQRMILVGTQQRLNFDLIVDTMLLQYPEFRGAPPVVGRDGNTVNPKGNSKGNRSTSSSSSSFSASASQSSTAASSSYRGASTGKMNLRRQVHLTNNENATNELHDDEEFMDVIDEEKDEDDQQLADQEADDHNPPPEDDGNDNEEFDPSELAQVLTLTAKKLSNLTLGRKFTNRPKTAQKTKLSAQDKLNTHCSACGAVGHWYRDPECPRNGGSGGPAGTEKKGVKGTSKGSTHKVGIIHHDYGSVEIHEDPQDQYGNMFSVQMVGYNRFQVNEINFNHTDQFKGYMIIDTGCQRTCCGKLWLDAHLKELKYYDMIPKMVSQRDEFQFGKGEPSIATCKAYLPSAIAGVPLLLGTSVLEDNVPFLASNSLLTHLGAIVNLVTDSVFFQRLGAEVKIYRMGGHMAINIFDFMTECPSQLEVWELLSRPHVWKKPHPEIILSTQSFRPGQPSSHQPDASSTAMLVAKVAPDDSIRDQSLQADRDPNDGSNPLPCDAQERVASTSTNYGLCDQPGGLRTSKMPKIRQSTRALRRVSGLPTRVEVERRHSEVGGTWVAKSLIALATIATSIFKQHDTFKGISEEPSTSYFDRYVPSQDHGPAASSSTSTFDQQWMDQFSIARDDGGAPHPGTTTRGLQHRPTDFSSRHGATEYGPGNLPVGGSVSRVEGGDGTLSRSTTMGQADRIGSHRTPGRRDLRLGCGGFTTLKPGNAKRVRGDLQKSSRLLQLEHSVYAASTTAKDRPSPSADLWELFAGRALCTELAAQHGLVALQPWDLLYGQDLMESSTRHEAMRVQKRFRPHLIMLGLDCRHYTRFNRNLNYAHRLDEWYELQAQDRPLLDLTCDLAEGQYKHGRFFWVENPQNSEVWEQDRIQFLLSLPGVWSVVVDAGAFGASIDDNLIAKPFRIIGNMPGLDEVLNQRLTAAQRVDCVPIQGSMTRRSQEYPHDMCLAVVQHLKEYVHQQQPHRFCHVHQALPVQQPVADLHQWDKIVEQLKLTYDRTSRRPYEIGNDTELGKSIQDLFRMDTTKIQVVSTPTTRRFPGVIEEFPPTRAAFLVFTDGTRSVEVEDLQDVQFPKQRFSKAVRIAVFAFGRRRQVPQQETKAVPGVVPNLSTDIDFPGITSTVPSEVRAAVARMHLNMGHPSRQELSRLLAYQGDVPDQVYEAVRKLRCATCQRLQPPQQPRPSTTPSFYAGQFCDELQMDIFHCRTLSGESFKVLGIIDKATGFHQAIAPSEASSNHMFDCLEQIWFRPYGLPLKIVADPDTSFRGDFQERVQSLGCILELCPPEAHHVIAMIERRNSILRLVLEKLIDQFAATTVEQCKFLLSSACHAMNSAIHTHGRSAYQAVFGRQPRLLNSNFNDPMSLASSPPVARLHSDDYAYRAELVRAEAIKYIHDLDVSRHLRRALLRKTRITKVADVMPGQKVAFWLWAKRGGKKRGTWITATFLSWDPSAVGKQAWVRSGGSSILVTAEQLRCAFGFEQWTPDVDDIKALKSSTDDFTKFMLDDRGPPPPDDQREPILHHDNEDEDQYEEFFAPTPSMMVPVTPQQVTSTHQPPAKTHPTTPLHQPQASPRTPTIRLQQTQQNTTEQYNIRIDSPTNIAQQVIQHQQNQQFNNFGNIPQRSRQRSRTPISTRIRDDGVQRAEQPAQQQADLPAPLEQPATTVQQTAALEQPTLPTTPRSQASRKNSTVSHPAILEDQGLPGTTGQPAQQVVDIQAAAAAEQAAAAAAPTTTNDQPPATTNVDEPQQQVVIDLVEPDDEQTMEAESDPYLLPQKRPFNQLPVLIQADKNEYVRIHSYHDGSPDIGYGPSHANFHQAYLTTQQRQQDVQSINKDPTESDTTQDSDTDEEIPQPQQLNMSTSFGKLSPNTKTTTSLPEYKQGMTRQQIKALDREIPWRKVLEMPPSYVDKFLLAIQKEADSWASWNSVEPLSEGCRPNLQPSHLEEEGAEESSPLSRQILWHRRSSSKMQSGCLGSLRP